MLQTVLIIELKPEWMVVVVYSNCQTEEEIAGAVEEVSECCGKLVGREVESN